MNKALTGTDGDAINRLMDSTTRVSGPQHRKDLAHDPLLILALGLDKHDPNALVHAFIHKQLDATLTVRQAKLLDKLMGISKNERRSKRRGR